MPPLLETGLSNAVAATVLVACSYFAVRAKVRPAVAHALWLLALVKLLTPPLVAIPVAEVRQQSAPAPRLVKMQIPRPVAAREPDPIYPAAKPISFDAVFESNVATRGMIDPATGLPLLPRTLPASARSTPNRSELDEPETFPAIRPAENQFQTVEIALASPEAGTSFPWWRLAGLVWLTGMVGVLALSIRRVRQFHFLLRHSWPANAELQASFVELARRMGFDRPPRLRLLPGAVTPMVWAVGRPTVYFPADLLAVLSAEQRGTLLAHELAHLRRRDHWVRWVEQAAIILYWWLPAVKFARRGLHQAEEECCDTLVIQTFPDARRSYATALLDAMDFLADARPAPALASGLGEFAAVRRRLVLILAGQQRYLPGPVVRWTVTAFVCMVLPLAPTLAMLPSANDTGLSSSAFVADSLKQTSELKKPLPDPYAFSPNAAMIPAPKEIWRCIACSADGRLLALGGEEGVVTLWDVPGRKVHGVLRGHRGFVLGLGFSPDGKMLASGGEDHTIRIWDIETLTARQTLDGHLGGVSCVSFSPDGQLLASGSVERRGTVRIWNVRSGELSSEYHGHTASVWSVKFSPSGHLVASASRDATIRVWNLLDEGPSLVLRGHRRMVRSVDFRPGVPQLASAGDDGSVRIWNLETGQQAGELRHDDSVACIAYSPGGNVLMSATLDGRLFTWDARTGHRRGEVLAHAGPVTALVMSPDCRRLFTAGRDRTVRLWAARSRPTPEQLAADGAWWLGLYSPVSRWMSPEEDRPGALWSWMPPVRPGRVVDRPIKP